MKGLVFPEPGIGPVGALEFLLTAIVDFVRFASLSTDEVEAYGAATGH